MGAELLDRLERYYDTAPRVMARPHPVGPFTVFVGERGWPYFARPALGVDAAVTVADVARAVRWQTGRGQPGAFEWIEQTRPSMAAAARDAGLVVHRYPLLVLDRPVPAVPVPGIQVCPVTASDAAILAELRAVLDVGFGRPGTARGPESAAERDAAGRVAARPLAAGRQPADDPMRLLLTANALVVMRAVDDTDGAVGGGSHAPHGDITELTGIATLPAHRRRGIATLVTAALVDDALARGVRTVFCCADGDAVAQIYQGAGFVRVGTACTAHPSE